MEGIKMVLDDDMIGLPDRRPICGVCGSRMDKEDTLYCATFGQCPRCHEAPEPDPDPGPELREWHTEITPEGIIGTWRLKKTH